MQPRVYETRKDIRTFEAKGDDGNIETVIEYQMILYRQHPRTGQWVQFREGPISFELEDGTPVNPTENKTYRVLDTDQILREV